MNPEQGWLGRALLAPGRALADLRETLEHALVSTEGLFVVAAGLAVLAAVGLAVLWRRGRLSARARQITVLTPPEVDAKGALTFWAHLIGQLRPAWARVLLGQPHLGFEYTVTPEEGAAIRLWVPGAIPPGLIERAVASAWPGAHTHTREPARLPLPNPVKGVRRVVAGGELRLGRHEGLPLSTDHSGDLVRNLITAADDLAPGQAVCVQVLARPVTGRRVARATRSAASTSSRAGVAPGLLREALEVLTPGTSGGPASRISTGAGTGRGSDRQTSLEYSAAARAAAAKARGAHWETVVRYAASIPVSTDPAETGSTAQARAVARGRADALATTFGACTDHNYYRRRRRLRLERWIRQRRLGRGDVLSVPELATIAHLPTDDGLPGLQRAGARALSPHRRFPSAGITRSRWGPRTLAPAARSRSKSATPVITCTSSARPVSASPRCWRAPFSMTPRPVAG
ncbi:hypothetical protein [Nocardia asteroides]|uniref:hypothetical protein n=1 Tax=Nocardia asteroides TaxID=1824 RepID=UPI001E3127EC|nr:hypothetical protein [Nocardia asteroides]UGT53994.1 hypothetical protein LTT85_25540 [Nocardia asteroides]